MTTFIIAIIIIAVANNLYFMQADSGLPVVDAEFTIVSHTVASSRTRNRRSTRNRNRNFRCHVDARLRSEGRVRATSAPSLWGGNWHYRKADAAPIKPVATLPKRFRRSGREAAPVNYLKTKAAPTKARRINAPAAIRPTLSGMLQSAVSAVKLQIVEVEKVVEKPGCKSCCFA